MSDFSKRVDSLVRERDAMSVAINLFHANMDKIEALLAENVRCTMFWQGQCLNICNLSYAEMTTLRRLLGVGRVRKSSNDSTMNYEGTTEDGLKVDFFQSGLPPTCRVVYDKVDVPAREAHIETRARVVCEDVEAQG